MMSIDGPKKSRGRPPVDTEAVKVRLPRADIQGIDSFAASEPDAPTRTEALRRIVADWLRQNGYLPK